MFVANNNPPYSSNHFLHVLLVIFSFSCVLYMSITNNNSTSSSNDFLICFIGYNFLLLFVINNKSYFSILVPSSFT